MNLPESILSPNNYVRPSRRQSLYCGQVSETTSQFHQQSLNGKENKKQKIQIRYSFKIRPKDVNSSLNSSFNPYKDHNLSFIKVQSAKQNTKIPLNQYNALKQIGTLTNSIQQMIKKINAIKKQCQAQQPYFNMARNSQIQKKHFQYEPKTFVNNIYCQNLQNQRQIISNQYLTKKGSLQSRKSKLLDFEVVKIKSKNITIGDFQLGKKIGSGKFGDVLQCRHKQTGALYALKKILKSTIIDYGMIKQFTQELKIHYKLQHPNVIQLITHFEDDYHIFMLMEYAIGGNLLSCLKKEEKQISRIINQVVNGLSYIHSKKVCHRDIKPQNILMGINGQVKICDFGWSCGLKDGQKIDTLCGTPDYISPQMKSGLYYDTSVDLWSLGVLTYQLLTGYTPFKNQVSKWVSQGTKKQYQWNWQLVKYPLQISIKSKKFIEGLLQQNPSQRSTLWECKNSLFLRS